MEPHVLTPQVRPRGTLINASVLVMVKTSMQSLSNIYFSSLEQHIYLLRESTK